MAEKVDTALTPCPFCGCAVLELSNTHTASYWIECTNCGAQVTGEPFYGDDKALNHLLAKRSAVKAWNRREGPDARVAELEAELLVITGAVEDALPHVDDMQTRRELRAAIAKGTTDETT